MTGPLPLDGISSAEDFLAAMRQLKERSGLTLRQLEERAAARGDVLARSTAADVLRRRTLPRPALVVAFVRACGDDDRVSEWMRAYERLVTSGTAPAVTGTAPEPGPAVEVGDEAGAPVRPRTRARLLVAAVASALVAVAGAVAVTAFDDPPGTSGPDALGTGAEVLPLVSAGSWGRLRTAHAPDLCVTEGTDRRGRYRTAVAVQRPCGEPGGPRTFFQPIGDDLTTVKWEHPEDRAMGCLTILDDGPGTGLVEPQGQCPADKDAQHFRIERAGPGSEEFRLRRARTDQCLAVRDGDTSPGAEVVARPCADDPAQRFLVDLAPAT